MVKDGGADETTEQTNKSTERNYIKQQPGTGSLDGNIREPGHIRNYQPQKQQKKGVDKMIFKVITFMIILSIFKEMDEAKEKKDLCDIVYWGVLMTITIALMVRV